MPGVEAGDGGGGLRGMRESKHQASEIRTTKLQTSPVTRVQCVSPLPMVLIKKVVSQAKKRKRWWQQDPEARAAACWGQMWGPHWRGRGSGRASSPDTLEGSAHRKRTSQQVWEANSKCRKTMQCDNLITQSSPHPSSPDAISRLHEGFFRLVS